MDRLIDTLERLTGRASHPSFLDRIVHGATASKTSPLTTTSFLTTRTDELTKALRDANPLNLLLGAIALYILATIIMPESVSRRTPSLSKARSAKCHAGNSYSFLPDEHPPVTQWKKYTPRTLAVHDGSGISNKAEAGKILLAIEGRVFDVTKGANFYGPGGPYGNFAGRDASRGMAKQSFDQDMLTPLDKPLDKLDDLVPMEVNNMREWVSHFSAKYTIVGELVNEGEQGDDG